MDEILDLLNEEQILPVKTTEGPVLVLAGAGSGKTRVLTSRIAYILREGLAMPSQILAITFTNKAAGEMKERVATFVDVTRDMWICTIHSMCVRILRNYGSAVGVKDHFSIYSETEKNNVIKKAFQELDYDDDKLLKDAKYHISQAKMLGLDPDQYATKYSYEDHIEDIARIFEHYNKHLEANNALDFDDLLIYALRLLRKDKDICEYLSSKFKYILVDEFQDTNAVQYNIIKLLAKVNGNLFVVGDDDQSIYGWRGAEIENILKFDRDFPQAQVFRLQRNYRSTKNILALANSSIAHNTTRHKKELWTEAEDGSKPTFYQADEESGEALFVARKISSAVLHGANYSDFAVLMRINALTRSFEQECTKYGIPYKVFGGFKFFERKEIKDILAYLRIISNPYDDEAFERIINVPKRGIGPRTIEAMYEYATEQGLSLYDALIDLEQLPLASGAKNKLKDFSSIIKQLVVSSLDMPVNDFVRQVMVDTNIRSAYQDGTEEGESKLANLDEFISSVDDFAKLNQGATLDDYLASVTLYSDTEEMDNGNYVTLATIHAVKGLEFKNVFMVGLEDGIMPSSRSDSDKKSLEEERRLMYVAITRAQKELYLTRSCSRYLYGHREVTKPSRFVMELAEELGIKDELRSNVTPVRNGYSGGYDGYRRPSYGQYGNTSYGYSGPYQAGTRQAPKPSYDEFGYYSDEPQRSTPKSTQSTRPQTTPKSTSFQSTYGVFNNTPKPNAQAGTYTVGMKVSHAKFGIGTIIAIKGQTLSIAFDGKGIVQLSSAIAPLKIL